MKSSLFLLPIVCLSLSSCDTRNEGEMNRGNRAEVMPMNASESPEDQKMILNLREALATDQTLSLDAKRIQIMALNGVITLRGTVSTEKEKNEIAKKANALQGVKSVDNQLQIVRM